MSGAQFRASKTRATSDPGKISNGRNALILNCPSNPKTAEPDERLPPTSERQPAEDETQVDERGPDMVEHANPLPLWPEGC